MVTALRIACFLVTALVVALSVACAELGPRGALVGALALLAMLVSLIGVVAGMSAGGAA